MLGTFVLSFWLFGVGIPHVETGWEGSKEDGNTLRRTPGPGLSKVGIEPVVKPHPRHPLAPKDFGPKDLKYEGSGTLSPQVIEVLGCLGSGMS